MRAESHSGTGHHTGLLVGLMTAFLVLGSPATALGELGGTLDSIQADQQRMRAEAQIQPSQDYTVHEIKAPTGTVVREYVSSSGRVFGVAWQGPFVPDLRQLLGSYFEQYSRAAQAQRASRVGRQPLNIQEEGLVVQTSGHMRAYAGRAYDPGLLPSGVSANVIR